MSLRIHSSCGAVLEDLLVRADATSKLEVHLDNGRRQSRRPRSRSEDRAPAAVVAINIWQSTRFACEQSGNEQEI